MTSTSDSAATWIGARLGLATTDFAGPFDSATPTGLGASLVWLVRMRWVAIAGVALALWAARALGLVDGIGPPFAVLAALGLANLWLSGRHRALPASLTSATARRAAERAVTLEIHVDLVALAFLLHYTGGVQNPFALFYVFHAAIGAMLLCTWRALLIGASASVLYAALVIGELQGLCPHHPLHLFADGRELAEPLWRSPTVAIGHVAALAMTLFGTIYFVQSVVRRKRHSDELRRQHERVAQSRERLARIGEFSAGLAHSVRNPLHGALSCIEILKHNDLSESHRDTLGMMDEALRRIERVTSRLLVLTREAPLRPAPADIEDHVHDILRFAEMRMREHGIAMHTDLAAGLRVELDPDRFHEALTNVLDNAIAACAGRVGARIVVRATANEAPHGGVHLVVEDDGAGISQTDLRHVFDPFFTTKAVGEGSGLGLAISRRIIEDHGGTIWIDSEVGRGTSVHILLPGERPAPETPTRRVSA